MVLPNNPNYRLGHWVGSKCDTLITNIEELEFYRGSLFAFPQPCN